MPGPFESGIWSSALLRDIRRDGNHGVDLAEPLPRMLLPQSSILGLEKNARDVMVTFVFHASCVPKAKVLGFPPL